MTFTEKKPRWRPPRDRPRAKQELPDFLLYPINHATEKAVRARRKKERDLLKNKKTYGLPHKVDPYDSPAEPPDLDREKREKAENEALRISRQQLVDPATCIGMFKNCLGLDINELNARLIYFPDTGKLYWRWRRNSQFQGDKEITAPVVGFEKRSRNVIGVIYLLMLGQLPQVRLGIPDNLHRAPIRDGDVRNRRWENIKPYTHAEINDQRLESLRASEEQAERRRLRRSEQT